MAKAKEELTVVAAAYVSLPSKNLVLRKMSNGTVEVQGVSTMFQAQSAAHAAAKDAHKINEKDVNAALGIAAFVK